MILMLRVLAECPDAATAAALSPRLLAAAAAWRAIESSPPERYERMPELYEFTLLLSPPTAETFDAVVASVPGRWTHGGDEDDRSSVWNRESGATLLVPEVLWAELLRHRAVHDAG